MKRHVVYISMFLVSLWLTTNALAAVYYVKQDGNDKLDGLSDANAWQTIGKVNGFTFSTGDDVYFKCDDTWTGIQLNIDWSGTSGNRAVVGAYYGSGTIGVSGNKPVIDGYSGTPTTLEEWQACEPASDYRGLIQISGQGYVTVQDIKAVDSRFYGLGVGDPNPCDHINATNFESDHTYNAGLRWKEVDTGIIEGCDIQRAGYSETFGFNWPACLVMTASHGITIRKNVVHECYGEGIGLYARSYNCIIEDNVCYAIKKGAIYIDHAWDSIIRRNLVYGTTDTTFHRSSWGPGSGISINDEDNYNPCSENNKVYNNLIAYCRSGIKLSTMWPDWPLKDTDVYNNIIVDCYRSFNLVSTRTTYENSHIKNNISWCISGDCTQASVPSGHSGLTFDYNLWSSTPDSDAQGTHDPSYAAPKLSKTSGWRTMTGGDLDGSEFALQAASPAIDSGTPLGVPFNHIPECDKSVWPRQIVLLDQDKQGEDWEIGADIHAANPPTLSPPTNLRILNP